MVKPMYQMIDFYVVFLLFRFFFFFWWGGVKGPGNSGEEGGRLVNLRFQMVKFDAMQICFKIVSYLL